MGMDVIELIYYVCFFLGFGFAVVSGLLSGVFSGGLEPHVDVGGAHGGHAGPGGHDGAVHFSPLSPVVLSMFIATFGGTGIILMKYMHWPMAYHLPVSGVSGLVVGGLVFAFFAKIFSLTQGSSESHAEEMVGQEAEVTVPIPNEGLGEIAYTSRGSRYTNPARTADGKELPAHTPVKIVKLVGTTYVVEKVR